MNRRNLNALKERIAEKKEKSDDLDRIVSRIMQLPYGQIRKVMTDEIMEILAKYGYTGG